MNFITFSVGSTNIFPIANSTAGGQLATEYNLRSRESVATPEGVKYMIGPSYVHSEDDFKLRPPQTTLGEDIEGTPTFVIDPGRGIVNGHFIESFVPMTIDMAEANALAQQAGNSPLYGDLIVGLRVMYSTLNTMAGSMRIENAEDMYEGIQVVVLPESEFKLPDTDAESRADESKVTAHLKLGTINFSHGRVQVLDASNYPLKCQSIPASRIYDTEGFLSDAYVTKQGIRPKTLYVFSGKGSDDNGYSTWCQATDSLMVWDPNADPTPVTTQPSASAQFLPIISGADQVGVKLVLPHKQVDGMKDSGGHDVYFPDVVLALPSASYANDTAGVVTADYTRAIKALGTRIDEFYQLPNGKQRGFIEVLNDVSELPPVDGSWAAGDYILVQDDHTVDTDSSETVSTLYVVVNPDATPWVVEGRNLYILREAAVPDYASASAVKPWEAYKNQIENIFVCDGVSVIGSYAFAGLPNLKTLTCGRDVTTFRPNAVSGGISLGYVAFNSTIKSMQDNAFYSDSSIRTVVISEGQSWSEFESIANEYSGNAAFITGQSVLHYDHPDTPVTYEYADPQIGYYRLLITGHTPLAKEDITGGFRNVDPESILYQDNGYVYLDDQGHLRVMDYALLRTGVLAYQLGQDQNISGTLTADKQQELIDDYINYRVMFPNSAQMANGSEDPGVINVTLNIPENAGTVQYFFTGIDSRFGSSLYLHIRGASSPNVYIHIQNCDRVRIDSMLEGGALIDADSSASICPTIVLSNSCLFYDKSVINALDSSLQYNVTLWYARSSISGAPDIVVDGMTVRCTSLEMISSASEDPWNESVESYDVHFSYGLYSLTFDKKLNIVGCTIGVADSSTAIGTAQSTYLASHEIDLSIPESFPYPEKHLKAMHVDGSFISGYEDSGSTGSYTLLKVNMALSTDAYDSSATPGLHGDVALFVEVNRVTSILGVTSSPSQNIPVLNPGTYHLFDGHVKVEE